MYDVSYFYFFRSRCVHKLVQYTHIYSALFQYGRYYFHLLFFFITSSTRRRGIWKKLSNNFNFTCVCKSAKQSLIFLKTSLFNCEQIEPLVHSLDVPSLLCSHKDVSLSRFAAIFQLKFQFQDSVNLSSKHSYTYTRIHVYACTHTLLNGCVCVCVFFLYATDIHIYTKCSVFTRSNKQITHRLCV